MKEEEMLEIADLIAEALAAREDERAIANVRQQVQQLTRRFRCRANPLAPALNAPPRRKKVEYLSRRRSLFIACTRLNRFSTLKVATRMSAAFIRKSILKQR